MIQFKDFEFYYHVKKPLHKNLNLSLDSGKIYGLFGKNGTGKTTLLKSIVGLVYPKHGEVFVNNHQPKKRTPEFLSDIFYLSDEFVLPKVSIEQYVKIYGPYYPNFSRSDFDRFLNKFELPLEGKPYKFSLGQQKKFLICFALACNTRVLVMDEPTNGLDIPSKVEFRKSLISIMDHHKTVFISTHQAKDLEQLLDHILILNNENMILNSPVSEISKKLAFNHYNQEPLDGSYLYCQSTPGGYAVVEENVENEFTNISTEQLMVAAISYPEKIKQIFLNN